MVLHMDLVPKTTTQKSTKTQFSMWHTVILRSLFLQIWWYLEDSLHMDFVTMASTISLLCHLIQVFHTTLSSQLHVYEGTKFDDTQGSS